MHLDNGAIAEVFRTERVDQYRFVQIGQPVRIKLLLVFHHAPQSERDIIVAVIDYGGIQIGEGPQSVFFCKEHLRTEQVGVGISRVIFKRTPAKLQGLVEMPHLYEVFDEQV